MESSTSQTRLLLSGLPAAGKTTFLAALWQVFESDHLVSALALDEYIGDQAYIVEINKAWANCEALERTRIQSPGLVRVRLRDRKGGSVDLEVPDLSGEAFRDHWVERRWEKTLDDLVRSATGIVLMVSALTKETLLISEIEAVEADLGKDAPVPSEPESTEGLHAEPQVDESADAGGSSESGRSRRWDPRESPTQVQLVEHLQFVAMRREGRAIPLVMVVAAWDQVKAVDSTLAPARWLATRLPLLDQYLGTRAEVFPSATFGISAQGGDLGKDRERLLGMRPVERLEVTDGHESGHDLSLPLAWLIEASKNG